MARSEWDGINGSLADIIKSYSEIEDDIKSSKSKKKRKKTYEETYYRAENGAVLDTFGKMIMAVPVIVYGIIDKIKDIIPKFAGGGNNGNNEPPENNDENNFNFRGLKNMLNWKAIGGVIVLILILIMSPLMFGINDAGHRTVIQYPNGTLNVKFEPGLYMQWFGRVDVYNDVITFDFDKSENTQGATIDQNGISVRYQDGGTGTVYGIARFKLPGDRESMVGIHKEFRSNDGVAVKILKPLTEEVMNHTAGLMTSEESYAEKRGTYAQFARDQIENGKYTTEQKEIRATELGFEFCLERELTPEQKLECRNVKKTTRMIPVIAYEKGMPLHDGSDLKHYSVSVTGFQMVDWGYESKTLEQIATKRKATMAIITAKAEAEKAKQDAVTAEQTGLANVVKAKYEQEVEKEKQVVIAEREKEVAEIQAQKKVEVARQQKLEAEQLKLAAVEYKQEQELRGEGDGAYKREVMEADGYAIQKIEAWKDVNIAAYTELAKQKWAPEIVMGGSDGGMGSSTNNLEKLLAIVATKSAKDLSLDMSIKDLQKK